MSLKVTIGGTDQGVKPDSLSIDDRMGSTPTAKFVMRRTPGGTLVTRGQEVVIWDDARSETIRRTVPGVTPPGLIYHEDNEGYVMCDFPFDSHANGSMEVVAAVLYNLPDLSPYFESDYYEAGVRLFNGEYTSRVDIGMVWVDAEGLYRYYAKFFSRFGETGYETTLVSTTEVALSTPRRISVTWETAGGGATCALKLYIDGVEEDSDTGTGTMAGYYEVDPNRVRIDGEFASLGFGLYYADFRLFLDVRTAEEIDDWAFLRLTGDELTDVDLEGYWKMDELTGIVVEDSGTAGNDGDMIDEGDGYMEWGYSPDTWLTGEGEPSCTDEANDYRFFGGHISKVTTETLGPGVVEQSVVCEGYAALCSRYRVNINFVNPHPGKYYVQYIGERILDDDGIGYGCIPEGSRIINVSDWKNKFAMAALNEVRDSTNWLWYIDPYKELRYHPRGFKAAPWNIASTDSPSHYLADTLTVSEDKGGYYNRLHARVRYVDELDAEHIIMITVSDDAEIAARAAAEGGNGVYEHYEDLSGAMSPEHGLDQAHGMISAASTLGKVVNYATIDEGLRVGQVQTITMPDLGLAGEFLIESISSEFRQGTIMVYKVQASSWLKPKVEPLSDLLASALESKKNWWESTMVDGEGHIIEIDGSVGVGITFSIEDGEIE